LYIVHWCVLLDKEDDLNLEVTMRSLLTIKKLLATFVVLVGVSVNSGCSLSIEGLDDIESIIIETIGGCHSCGDWEIEIDD
jgi:hypothetical protein